MTGCWSFSPSFAAPQIPSLRPIGFPLSFCAQYSPSLVQGIIAIGRKAELRPTRTYSRSAAFAATGGRSQSPQRNYGHIILGHTAPAKREVSIARLCVCRSGGRPLDFFITPTSALDPLSVKALIPDRRRLRSVVYWYVGEAAAEELASFLLPALQVERLEIRGDGPTLFRPRPMPPEIGPLEMHPLAEQ